MVRWTAQRTITLTFLLTGVLVLIAGQCAGHPTLLGTLLFACAIVVTVPSPDHGCSPSFLKRYLSIRESGKNQNAAIAIKINVAAILL